MRRASPPSITPVITTTRPPRVTVSDGDGAAAALTGFLVQAATRRTPVLLDSTGALACALLAQRIAFRAPEWFAVADNNPDPGFRKALDRLNLEPLLDFEVRLGAEHAAQALAHHRVVIGEQDPDHAGSSARTRVPAPGALRTSTLPPAWPSRSRMPRSPYPPFTTAGSNPRPSSVTSSDTAPGS